MGKLAGLVLIAAGVGTAAYVYPMLGSNFGSLGDRADRQLSDVVAIATGAVPAQPQPTRPPAIVIKPATNGTQDAARPDTARQETQRVVNAETTPGRLPLAQVAPKAPPVALVTPSPMVETPTARPIDVPQPATAKRPAKVDDDGKMVLTRDIQRELKRVGCFDGSADGVWTPETRQAMKSFIDRVNASLPVEDPDYILKSLVQGHPGNACGKSCPTGQALNIDGKCLPTAIIAQAPKRTTPPAAREAAAPSPAARTSSWDAKVVPAPEQRPQVAVLPEPKQEPRPTPTVRVEPLPGRTGLGASNVPPPGPPSTAVTDDQPKRPVVTVKQRETADAQPQVASVPPSAAAPLAPSLSASDAPAIGAVAAAAIDAAPAVRRVRPPVGSEDTERPRPRLSQPSPVRQSPPPRVTYAAPPNYYSPPPVYRQRPRFGPQIFREMERTAR